MLKELRHDLKWIDEKYHSLVEAHVMLKIDQNQQEIHFLLGKLTEDERSIVEDEFFQNAGVFDDLLIAENSLIDAYVTDRLSAEDRILFEKRLMRSTTQRKRVAFARELISYASQETQIDLTTIARKGIIERFFGIRAFMSYAVIAAVLLVSVGIGVLWFQRQTSSEVAVVPATEQPPMAPNLEVPVIPPDTIVPESKLLPPRQASNREIDRRLSNTGKEARPKEPGSAPKLVSTIILSIGSTRSGGAAQTFEVPPNVTEVRMQLPIEGELSQNYFALIETVEGRQVWRGSVRAAKGNARTLSFAVPGRTLRTGDYIVTLKASSKGEPFQTVGEYAFTVSRP